MRYTDSAAIDAQTLQTPMAQATLESPLRGQALEFEHVRIAI